MKTEPCGKQSLYALVAAICSVVVHMVHAAVVSTNTILRLGPMTGPVAADNEITMDEQQRCCVQYGGISSLNGLMAKRYVVYHFGYNDEGFYFGVRSSVPDHPIFLGENDRVTLTLLPPGAGKPYVFSRKTSEGRMLDGVMQYGVLCAETEMFVPFAELGGRKPAAGEKWGLQMSVDFMSPAERASWAWDPDAADALGTLVIDPDAPIVSVFNYYKLEMWRSSANLRVHMRIDARKAKGFKNDHVTVAHVGVGDSKLDSNPEKDAAIKHMKFTSLNKTPIAAGDDKNYVEFLWNLWPGTVNIIDFDVGQGDTTFLRRKFRWDLSKGVGWKDDEGLPDVRISFFPSLGNRLRINYRRGRKSGFKSGSLRVSGEKCGKVWEMALSADDLKKNNIVDITLGKLAEDEYRVDYEAIGQDGRRYRDYDEFRVASFPWQTAAAGKDRIIVPPFKPIRVEGEKVSFLLTAYSQKGLFWDKVFAKGDNILAGPVTLRLNGQEFEVTEAKVLEKAPDRVVRRLTAALPSGRPQGLSLVAEQTYEYDGFCKVRLSFDAKEAVDVKSLQLFVPIKDEVVKYFNVQIRNDKRAGPAPDFTFPSGEGEVWNSATDRPRTQFPIQHYIWLGGVEKGFSWAVQSCENWSLKKDHPAERAIRGNGAVTLVCDFVNEPVSWHGRRDFEMYFEPTPVKPRDMKHLKFGDLMYEMQWPSNSVRYACTFGMGTMLFPMLSEPNTYPAGDLSLVNWVKNSKKRDPAAYWKRMGEYVSKHKDWFDRQYVTSTVDYQSDKNNPRYMDCDICLVYWDPRLVTCFWPEWKMYRGEWHMDAYAPLNSFTEYLGDVTPSRVDKLMYDAEVSLRHGAMGLYYDCFYPSGGASLADGYAWVDKTMSVDGYCGNVRHKLASLMGWRDIMKRSAVLCTLYGCLYNGRPVTELHDTEGNISMVNAFSMTGLSTERSANGGDFQDRFCESFTLVNIIGGTTGKGSRFIVSTRVGDTARKEKELKSLLGFMCAYGVFSISDQWILGRDWFYKAWNIPFDYGIGEDWIEHHFYYDEKPQPYVHDGKDIRMNVLERKDGTGMLILVGNLGDATEFAFRPSSAGKPGFSSFIDAVSGEKVDPASVAVERHGYRMIYAK